MPLVLWFWASTVKPLLDAAQPRSLIEVGAARGHNTENLLGWAAEHDCVVHSIDPVPGFDVEQFRSRYGDRFVLHRARSHEILGELPTADVVLIDGDHNWWTVHGELTLLERRAQKAGRPFPLTLFHDVSWPYARRDMYYKPDDVPEEFRQPHRKANIALGVSALSDDRGINGGLFNADSEGTLRNGVLTAVEDFMRESTIAFRFQRVHGYSGLGIMASEHLLADHPELAARLDWLQTPEFLEAHCERIERTRASSHMALADAKRALRKATLRIAQLEKELAAATVHAPS